jgi:glucose/arabinose dehydrogenase/mono/diheme cytochrome c family protein
MRRFDIFRGAPVLLLVVLAAPGDALRAADKPAPLEIELEDLRPGLVASYQSLADKDAVLMRIDAKPAFTIGHSSPHPRIGPGPFEVVWQGILFFKETGPVSFDALVGGEIRMEVDGVTVLDGRGTSDTAKVGAKDSLNRPAGLYRLKIQYRSLPDVPARLQIWWQGAGFSREPLPAWLLKHIAADVSAAGRQDELAEQGRKAVARFGCARCHSSAFAGSADPPPGPSLADAGRRLNRTWLLHWLADPAKLRPDAHMPALFSNDPAGFVERWLIADYFGADSKPADPPKGDHRAGRLAFVSLGCAACHLLPDVAPGEQKTLDRYPLTGLAGRMKPDDLASFLSNPHSRYPDGRMPRLPLTPSNAQDIAAYLLLWSKTAELEAPKAPTADEIAAVAVRLKVRGAANAAAALVREKRCNQCHPGIGPTQADDVPIKATDDARRCLSGKTTPRYQVDGPTAKALAAYRAVATRERHASPFESRRRLLERAGCQRCHQRDSDRPPPLEEIGSTLGGAYLQYLPFQRTPRLTNLHQKYNRAYLATAVREGVSGLRPARYSYRMPAFGHDAEALLQALAEGDGELPAGIDPAPRLPDDPTIGTLAGPNLVGFTGYACVSCHVWNGQTLSEPDPGAVGPDLTRVQGRIRRDWFDRFLEDPGRIHPGTPMPGITPKGKPATLQSVLDGDPAKQRDALWAYFALGKAAPSPKPPAALAVTAPAAGEAPLVAQIPIRLPAGGTVESISILFGSSDLLIYDLGTAAPHSLFTGAQILRNVQGRLRSYSAAGTLGGTLATDRPLQLAGSDKSETPKSLTLHGYDRLPDGARLRWRIEFSAGAVELSETWHIVPEGDRRRLFRELHFTDVPQGHQVVVRSRGLASLATDVQPGTGQAQGGTTDGIFEARLTPDNRRTAVALIRTELPPAKAAPAVEKSGLADAGRIEGSLERPGYRAIAFPRPKTANGDDLVMPAAIAVHPRDGRVFVASLKTGEIFVLRDPTGDGKQARFDNYAHGLFQEALSMCAEDDGLYVLHRRNLTKIVESKRDGNADRFERVFALPHGIADTYDYGYGLVRDKTGAFVVSYAPYANKQLPGSGGLVRLLPGKEPREIAYGFRNPLGWCNGPDGAVFFTDNQGEWVATNKLSHIVEGRYYGFPNQVQKQHTTKPFGKPAVWVPYGWARSINGVTYDDTGGKFGPFAGQFFMAELMFGGAVVRANVEKVNGEYQGACFPFWGKGLLGPLTLAFDPKGRLFVGGITEPGWMAQPDRGALFRIDFTGQTPFEMQSLHVLPRGFKVVFTTPVDPKTAGNPASYQVEHYRYEYTGAYGSPELDRTRVAIERVAVAADGRSAELTTSPLVKDRVHLISVPGVRSAKGELPVHTIGAYTLNEIPVGK